MITGDNPFVAAGGAIIGETVGELYRDQTWGSDRPLHGTSEEESAKTTRIGTALAQVTAGTVAALLGQNPTPAAHAAEVAVRNNCFRIDIQMELERERREMLRQAGIDEAEEERIGLDFLRDIYSLAEAEGERRPTFWRGVGRTFEGIEWVMEQVNEAIPPLYWLNQGIGYGIETWVNSKASIGRTSAEVAANARALTGLLQLGSRSTMVMGGVTAGARGVFGRAGRMPRPGVLIGEEVSLPTLSATELSQELLFLRGLAGKEIMPYITEGGFVPSYWSEASYFSHRRVKNKVYQRDDILNLLLTDDLGRSNVQRMKQGLSPLGPDGLSIELHHMLQLHRGPIAEITSSFHSRNSRVIHINSKDIPSGINRREFDLWRSAYWRDRIRQIESGQK